MISKKSNLNFKMLNLGELQIGELQKVEFALQNDDLPIGEFAWQKSEFDLPKL